MTQHIEIGGQNRPVLFGFGGLYEYEQSTGRKALADFAELSGGIENASVTVIVDLIHAGLCAGYRAESKDIDFDKFDIAAWISDFDVVEKIMTHFADSFPQAGNGKPGKSKKKATPAK